MNEENALDLHDRAARGESLTAEESSQLEAWYSAQDVIEARELAEVDVGSLDISERIHEALEQVADVTRQIQKTMADNASLRREIASLRQEHAQQATRSG